MDVETFLTSLYVLVDDWWHETHRSAQPGPGRPLRFSEAEVLTLAVLSQWSRRRSERDFWRFADAHLRPYFPNLLSQSQLNRRVRALEPELEALQRGLACVLADGPEVYHVVVDTTLIPAVMRVREGRKGLFAGQAAFDRSISKTEWVYGFKVALSVSPEGVVTAYGLAAYGLAPANCNERPVGGFLLAAYGHDAFLSRTRGSPPCDGRGTGWRLTGPWSRRPRRRAPAGRGRRRRAAGPPASASSSRG